MGQTTQVPNDSPVARVQAWEQRTRWIIVAVALAPFVVQPLFGSNAGVPAVRASDLADEERAELRAAGLVFARQDYLTPDGLLALGAMLGRAATEPE